MLILAKPIEGNPILIYLSISNNAISVAIVQEVEKDQCLVYFISKMLHGEKNKSHYVIVRINLPIKKILRKLDLVGRMLSYQNLILSSTNKGILRLRKEGGVNERALLVDGVSNQKRSGAGIILEGTGGVLIELSLSFGFRASNNQAE
ncbi:hypothetical protein CR513_14148, partial [Mucuna pruriens]